MVKQEIFLNSPLYDQNASLIKHSKEIFKDFHNIKRTRIVSKAMKFNCLHCHFWWRKTRDVPISTISQIKNLFLSWIFHVDSVTLC